MLSKKDAADLVINFERNILKESGGFQDQIAASYGGINHIVFNRSGNYIVNPIKLDTECLNKLSEMINLFYIRQRRRTIKTIRIEYGKLGIGYVLRLFEGEVNKNINKEDLPQEEMFESEQQLLKIIHELKGVENRQAQFRSVIALILNGSEYLFEGIIEGQIAPNPFGKNGFGYDPVFLPEKQEITFAQMSLNEKNKISHRSRALKKLVEFLKS